MYHTEDDPYERQMYEEAQWGYLEIMCGPICQCDIVEHGLVRVISCGGGPGFTGAPIFWATLSCGCQLLDESADVRAAQ